MTRFIQIKLTTQTPLIVVKKTVKNWYMSYGNYIPARTFLGALMTRLGFEQIDLPGKIRKSLGRKPVINVSDLYIIDENPCYPAPPLLFKKKIEVYPGKSLDCGIDRTINLYLEPGRTEEIEESMKEYLRECGKPYMKDYGGRLIQLTSVEPGFKPCNPRIIPIESVGVDPVTGSNTHGLLFTYEAIPPGTRFHGLIALIGSLGEDILKILRGLNGKTMYMGRGTSRGFGHVRIEEVSEKALASGVDPANTIEGALKKTQLAGKEITPFITLSELDLRDDSIKPLKTVSVGVEYSIGWSRLKGLRKPMIKTFRHGTIIYAGFSDPAEYYKGLLRKPGYNFFIPLEAYWEIMGGK